MYQRKLIVAFSVFLLLAIAEAIAVYWAFQTTAYHTERSRAAQQMLTHMVQFRAEAKRLQIWLANSIIANHDETYPQDELFERMSVQLREIEQLNENVFLNSRYDSDTAFALRVNEKSENLREKISALKETLQEREATSMQTDSERWQTLVALVDEYAGFDISSLVSESINLHTEKSVEAEQDAKAINNLLDLNLILFSVISLLLFFGLSWYLTRHFSASVKQLTEGTERIEAGNFDQPIPEQGSREFAQLAQSFNKMANSLLHLLREQKTLQNATEDKVIERTAQLQHVVNQLHEAEERQKGFISEITHELRTPTTIILGESELALRGGQSTENRASFERILDCCHTLRSRIDDLIMLSKGQHALVSVTLQQTSVAAVYQQLVAQVLLQTAHHQVSLDYARQAPPPPAHLHNTFLLVDNAKLDLAFRILIENAIQYQENDLYLGLRCEWQNTAVKLQVIDRGIGLNEADKTCLFTRHQRGAKAMELRPNGLGLGLCIAKSIIDAHDGTLTLEANEPRGVIAQISLPLFDNESSET
ncbi:hypothetical protein CWE08_07330 [Aliidiomarina iranensis]|uniref:histidine kinase n=1 Tax=Aliidiomarina iranensis TaxID=1434071 RepID=A0A432VWF2_9GAMM|nr:HAMP domain-containing sensor histidine kinase [Aliidiomarina iranensis]RUO20906.1 hypothetical protein CWE08_07330 [Aliidiomarina iranensis]